MNELYVVAIISALGVIIAAFIAKSCGQTINPKPITNLRLQAIPALFVLSITLFIIAFPVFAYANIIRTTTDVGDGIHRDRKKFVLKVSDKVEESRQEVSLCVMHRQPPKSSCAIFYKKVLKQVARDKKGYIRNFGSAYMGRGYVTSMKYREEDALTTPALRETINVFVNKTKEDGTKYEGLDGQVELLSLILHDGEFLDKIPPDVKLPDESSGQATPGVKTKDRMTHLKPYDRIALIAGVIGEILFE